MRAIALRRIGAMLLAGCIFAAPACAADELAVKFGSRPGVEQVSLSPDGTQVAFLGPAKGMGSSLMVAKVGEPNSAKVVLTSSGDPDRLQWCEWTSDTRLYCMLIAQVHDGENILYLSRLFAINSDQTNGRMLSQRNDFRSLGYNLYGGGVIDRLPDEPGSLLMTQIKAQRDTAGTLVGSTNRENGLMVVKINTETGKTVEMERARPENQEFITDGFGNVRIRGFSFDVRDGYNNDKVTYSFRRPGKTDWEKLSERNTQTHEGFDPWAVDPKLNVAYGFSKRDGRQALYKAALDGSGDIELVYANPEVDVDGLERIGPHQRVVGVSYATDTRHVEYFDPEIAKLRTSLGKALPDKGIIGILDSNRDETRLLIHGSSDTHAGTWYVLDRTTKRMTPVLEARPQLNGVQAAPMKAIRYQAADGTMVPAYLTLPVGGAQKNIPAIVLPHGGPSARDEWGFDWLTQYFAAKGYAVIQPQFRGSSGYGDQWFQDNGFKQWRVAISDVADAGRWLVKEGIANPEKLSIVGWSYGGYAALQSAATYPDLFKSVVAIAPVTDLDLLREQYRRFSNFFQASAFIGGTDIAAEGSPARLAAKIKAPVLLFHGGWDRNVDIGHSKRMDSALKAAGVPHKLITWDKLDHYLEDSDARILMLTQAGAFLENPQAVVGN